MNYRLCELSDCKKHDYSCTMSCMSFTFNDKNVIKSWKDTTSNKMYVVYIYKLQYVFLYIWVHWMPFHPKHYSLCIHGYLGLLKTIPNCIWHLRLNLALYNYAWTIITITRFTPNITTSMPTMGNREQVTFISSCAAWLLDTAVYIVWKLEVLSLLQSCVHLLIKRFHVSWYCS